MWSALTASTGLRPACYCWSVAHGGAAFVQALSRLGLIDEYRLIILPIALGNGLPLFKDLAGPLRVDLTEAKSFPDGTVIHVYQPIRTTAYHPGQPVAGPPGRCPVPLAL